MNETELKNCPFCKGNARVSTRQTAFLGYVGWLGNKKINYAAQVICNKCKARGPIVTELLITGSSFRFQIELLKDSAIEAWNRRADNG